MADDSTLREMFIRMEGKQDLTNDRLKNVSKGIDDVSIKVHIHAGLLSSLASKVEVLSDHSNRISKLETDNTARLGERKGLEMGGRVVWMVMGVIPITVIIAVFRAFVH